MQPASGVFAGIRSGIPVRSVIWARYEYTNGGTSDGLDIQKSVEETVTPSLNPVCNLIVPCLLLVRFTNVSDLSLVCCLKFNDANLRATVASPTSALVGRRK